MSVLAKILNFLLYGNVWIAAAAFAMAMQTQLLLTGRVSFTPLLGFVASGTILLYSSHRLMSLHRAGPFKGSMRFRAIASLKPILKVIVLLSAPAAFWFFWQLPGRLQLLLLPAGFLSLGYTLPLFRKRPLRDIDHLKTFLVAIVWSWITVVAVAAQQHMATFLPAIFMTLERFFFIFALTLPFDLRDREMDAYHDVRTIPARLGPARTKMLAAANLSAMLGCAWLNYRGDAYPGSVLLALGFSAVTTFLLIAFAHRNRNDHYYYGLIDGAMILQSVLVIGALSH